MKYLSRYRASPATPLDDPLSTRYDPGVKGSGFSGFLLQFLARCGRVSECLPEVRLRILKIMMNRLRGRSLAHPGCLVGVTTGLIVGIILAGVLARLNVPFNADLLVWLGLTVGLGALGWVIGSALTSRFPALEEKDADPPTPMG
jgi:hypothetical protein